MSVELLVRTEGAEATQALAGALARHVRAGDLLLLSGELGAGKTTFTQGLAAGLGVRGPVTSPTFVLARVHPSLVGGPDLVHVDAYRLTSTVDVDDLDLDATLAGSVTVVEWGAGRAEQLATDRLEITLAVPDDDTPARRSPDDRLITLRGVGARWSGLVDAVELAGVWRA